MELGSSYKFKNKSHWFTLKILEVGRTSYGVETVNASVDSHWEVGHNFRLAKDSKLFEYYQVMEVGTREPDHIIYTPELINLYIDMALQTLDQIWFDELITLKKEMLENV